MKLRQGCLIIVQIIVILIKKSQLLKRSQTATVNLVIRQKLKQKHRNSLLYPARQIQSVTTCKFFLNFKNRSTAWAREARN